MIVVRPSEHGDNEEELAALYALEILEGAELAQFERHMAGCERCHDLVAGHRRVATALALSVAPREASPGFKEHLIQAAVATASPSPPETVAGLSELRPLLPRLRLWTAALAAGLILAVGGVIAGTQLYAGQTLLSVTLKGASIAGEATLVVQRSGNAVLRLDGLDAPPAGYVYEVWVIDKAGAAPAGTSADGRGSLQLSRPVIGKTVAITVEPAPGGPAPTSNPILAADVGS